MLEAHDDEIAELRAASRRLVLAADAERHALERELHAGVQQHLVALSVELQLVRSLAETDPVAAVGRLEDAERDLRAALEAAAELAQRISAPVSGADGLGAVLRAMAVGARAPASVEVEPGLDCSPEVARTVYLFWLDALECRTDRTPAISVRDVEGALGFDVVAAFAPDALAARRDRVEALGGSLTVKPASGGGVRVRGTLPRP